jgi:hypothetical protein
MTTKDYVYLGLLLLTALAFYCNGFYAGVCRSKKVYETLLNDAEQDDEAAVAELKEGKSLALSEKQLGSSLAIRGQQPAASRKELRGDFGSN